MGIRRIMTLVLLLFLTGCTAISVSPVPPEEKLAHVCIKENPKVIVSNFVPTLESLFESHLITTDVFSHIPTKTCEYVLEYTALQSWDFVTYLSYAEFKLYKGSKRVGYAEYRLRGKGGFSLLKWRGPKAKLKPVIDQLLAEQKI